MGKVKEQKLLILDWLQINNKLTLEDATELLSVSQSTVRRLFAGLEEDGRAICYHGGIQLIPFSKIDKLQDHVKILLIG